MPFSYHPPTRDHCPICESLALGKQKPIIESSNGKASSASNFPIHNWYYFVLGYSPEFPDYLIEKYNISTNHFVVDPFNGSGTTMIACKMKGIPSAGIEANDYFVDVAKTKLCWEIDAQVVKFYWQEIRDIANSQFSQINFQDRINGSKLINGKTPYTDFAAHKRPEMLSTRYISDRPFTKISIIKALVDELVPPGKERDFFNLAVSSILVPISNVRYGPGFGVTRPKEDVDVLSIFDGKVQNMLADLEKIETIDTETKSSVIQGDSRSISDYFDPESVDYMITSPPYPGDHEYTKHTRLELIFMGYASNLDEFRVIKKRMLRGSTTNIYKADNEGDFVRDLVSIQKITKLIDQRLIEDNATSGFEKLYTKLIWEYFGGMYLALESAYKILKNGGKYALLVSDSHAFKMVHIETAKILSEIATKIGYTNTEIELWQDKVSSSHNYHIPENILVLTK